MSFSRFYSGLFPGPWGMLDPLLSTTVHDLCNYSATEIRFGMRYADAVTSEKDGTPVLDLTRIGALEPDAGDRQEQGWTEREETSSRFPEC